MIWETSGVSEDFGTAWARKLTKTANFLECVDTFTVDQVINCGVKFILSECRAHEGDQKKRSQTAFHQKHTHI